MKFFNSVICALWLGTYSVTQAGPLATRTSSPHPVRLFTISGFETPYPVGTGITVDNLSARNGNLNISPKHDVQKAILFVSGDGKAYLDSKKKEPIYIDAYNGLLAYPNPAPPNAVFAVFADFVHKGHGNTIFHPGNGFTSPGQSSFEWIGAESAFWWACGTTDTPGEEYQLWKNVFVYGGDPDVTKCRGVFLSALDYTGQSPAVDSYS